MTSDAELVEGSSSTEPSRESSPERSTVRRIERPLTLVVGLGLLLRGLARRGLRGTGMALAGGWLLYRGARSDRPVSRSKPAAVVRDRSQQMTARGATEVRRSVTVDLPPDELHEYWRKPEYLSEIVSEFAQVTPVDGAPADGDRFHWRIEGPMGRDVSWDTEIVEDVPGERLRWKTVEGATVASEWVVSYRELSGDRGTEVTLRARVEPPGGPVGAAAANRLGFALESAIETALDRFERFAETGEVRPGGERPTAD